VLGRAAGVLVLVATVASVVVPQHPARAWSADRVVAAAARHGAQAVDGARALRVLVAQAARADDASRLALINDFFNQRAAFAEDLDTWGVADHWTTPLELLGRGRGDCEDYAIAKYFALRAAGVPVQRLRLVYVRAQVGGQAIPHLVLAWYAHPSADPLVLDNLVPDVRAATRRGDLTPVFSFNSEGLWQGTGGTSAGDPLQRLSKWRDVLARARDEGFD
jgi:predicted transglutaminase-like cysteine proteinase